MLIAQENITMDKATAHSTSKVKKIATSAPMKIGMAAGTAGEEEFEEGYGKASELAVQASVQWNRMPEVDGVEERIPVGAYRVYFNSWKG